MSFFHPFTNARLEENSAKAVFDLFDSEYKVKQVKQGWGDNYYVHLKNGRTLRVKVGETTNLFGEKRTVIRYVDE